MKAIVNIATRQVELQYRIKEKDMAPFSHNDRIEHFNNFELTWKHLKTTYVECKHTISFDDLDEWQSTILFDGRTIDFHYDYNERKGFDSKKDWASYLFQGYEYIDGEPQLYDFNEVNTVTVIF